MRVRPVSRATRSISAHSASESDIGFSQNTCFPARSAAMDIDA